MNLQLDLADVDINFFNMYTSETSGLGVDSKLLLNILQELKPSLRTFDLMASMRQGSNWRLHSGVYTKSRAINIWAVNIFDFHFFENILPKFAGYNVARWHWELEEIPASLVNYFTMIDETWALSSFTANSLTKLGGKQSSVIPNAIILSKGEDNRRRFRLPEDSFLFLFAYDVRSKSTRKNPEGVIEAFTRAFSASDQSVSLVIKIRNSERSDLDKLKSKAAGYKNIYFLTQDFTRDEVASLFTCADCFVSLHRAEGLGLCLAESMYLGKPVIGTAWSGNLDFMTADNSCLVKCNLIKNQDKCNIYGESFCWADPDLDEAALYFKRIKNDEPFRERIANKGAETIRELFSLERVKEIIHKRLLEIINLPAFLNKNDTQAAKLVFKFRRRRLR